EGEAGLVAVIERLLGRRGQRPRPLRGDTGPEKDHTQGHDEARAGPHGAGEYRMNRRHLPDGGPSPGPRPAVDGGRRLLLAAAGASLLLPRSARAIGERSKLRLARLHLPDLPNPRPSALRRL